MEKQIEKKYSASELRALANELKEKTHSEGYESFHELQEAMHLQTALLNVASYLEQMEQHFEDFERKAVELKQIATWKA